MSASNTFPQVLYDYWHASDQELSAAIKEGVFHGVSVSSLLKAYLHVQLPGHREYDDVSPPTLSFLVIGRIIAELQSADHLFAMAVDIAQSLDHVTYRGLLLDARMPYPILRTFFKIPLADLPSSAFSFEELAIDIDDSVLANEDYLRLPKAHARDNAYLVTLEDLCNMLGISDRRGIQHFQREILHPIEIELQAPIFNSRPEIESQIQTDSVGFALAFEELSIGLLHGLDWTNVYVAGPLVLACLTGLDINIEKIHIHIYGLNVYEANRKLNQIYKTWLANHQPDDDGSDLVIKSAKTMMFHAGHGLPTVVIELDLFDSVTSGLLHSESDLYAMCYDGANVLMLPRCARAIETGHSILTSRLWYGSGVNCGLRKIYRVMELDHAFGLRILPSYARSLKENLNIQGVLKAPYRLQGLPVRVEMFSSFENSEFEDFHQWLHTQDQTLFGYLQEAICSKLGIVPTQRFGYSNYLTRRIRHNVTGPNLHIVQQKQMTMPFLIPWDLEEYLHAFPIIYTNNNLYGWCSDQIFIEVHDSTKHDPATAQLPSLSSSTPGESGNLKYWIISNESMWAGQDRLQDAISEVISCLVCWFVEASRKGKNIRTDSTECLLWTINYLRQRLAMLPIRTASVDDDRRKQGLPPLQGTLLFRALVKEGDKEWPTNEALADEAFPA